jgi:excisionase family DNA binding protein
MHTPQTTNSPITKLLLTAREAAKAMSISERTLYSLEQRGELRPVRVGVKKLYPPAILDEWIRARSGASSAEAEGGEAA